MGLERSLRVRCFDAGPCTRPSHSWHYWHLWPPGNNGIVGELSSSFWQLPSFLHALLFLVRTISHPLLLRGDASILCRNSIIHEGTFSLSKIPRLLGVDGSIQHIFLTSVPSVCPFGVNSSSRLDMGGEKLLSGSAFPLVDRL